MITLPTLNAQQQYHLARALKAIAAAETGPTAKDLAAAPVLDLWRPLVTLDAASVLWGYVTGYPRIVSGPVVTSVLLAIDRVAGWARTLSRWYVLATSFSAFEGVIAQEQEGMRIVGFELSGFLPVDDPEVLDQLIASYVARLRAFDKDRRMQQ